MADELVQMTYRQLSERLGISPAAARMRAKRAAKKGDWRIIPGNHPSDRVLVELPESALHAAPARDGGARGGPVRPARKGGEQPRTEDQALTGEVLATLRAAYDRIEELTGQLLAEKETHARTTMELAQAETREMGLGEEIYRLEATVARLEAELDDARRPWWRRRRRAGGEHACNSDVGGNDRHAGCPPALAGMGGSGLGFDFDWRWWRSHLR